MTTEYRSFQVKMSKLEASLTKRTMLLEMENDRLRLELAARDRRMEAYENSDASSSTGSLYNAERAAFRKKMEKEDVREGGPETNDEDKARRGRLRGTPAHRTATRPTGQSRCTCANARHVGKGIFPDCRPR